jgi:hypothetical protein
MADTFIILFHIPSKEIVAFNDVSHIPKINMDLTLMELLLSSILDDDYMYLYSRNGILKRGYEQLPGTEEETN